jgi:hypothetical protein
MPNKEQKSDTTKDSTTSSAKGTPLTGIQAKFDKEQEQGFRGTEVDAPNENYSVAGNGGLPTPETDIAAAKQAREDTGMGLSALEAQQNENEKAGSK